MKECRLPVVAVGFSNNELEALECMFQLSDRYRLLSLLPSDSSELAVIALVNIDDSDAISYWKSELDRSDLTTIVVSEDTGRYGEITYLPRRFIKRPCFAKQVLSVLDRVVPANAQANLAETEQQSVSNGSVGSLLPSQATRKLNRWVESWFKTEQRHNPYYTA